MSPRNELPRYAAELDAYHRAHVAELRSMIDDLPIAPGDKAMDLACGDGTYAAWLAERVGEKGLVVGVDASLPYLEAARDKTGQGTSLTYLAGKVESLPVADNAFDLVWCAQSLVSLPRPVTALREMRRVVRPRGVIAVMENDSLHQVLLPWSEDLELAVRQAELTARRAASDQSGKPYIARRLRKLFQSAGLVGVGRKTYSTDRCAPLSEVEEELLRLHFEHLRDIVLPYLSAPYQRQFQGATDPDSPDYLPRQEGFEMTWLDVVCWGRKPADPPRPARRLHFRPGSLARRSLDVGSLNSRPT